MKVVSTARNAGVSFSEAIRGVIPKGRPYQSAVGRGSGGGCYGRALCSLNRWVSITARRQTIEAEERTP